MNEAKNSVTNSTEMVAIPLVKLDNLIAAVEQMKAGKMRPFMYAIQGPDGEAHIDESCVAGDPATLAIEVNGLNDSPDTGYQIVPVYLGAPPVQQPAPVAGQDTEQLLCSYLLREMPSGTVICDPTWWAARIAKVFAAPVAAPVAMPAASAQPFQQRVQPWMMACFGAEISADTKERNHRFFEESTELVQAQGMTASEAHQLVDYVYGRPVGEPAQEVGGVMVTLAALCLANGLDMHQAAEVELARIWTKAEAIRAKQAAKPKHSPLPQAMQPNSGRDAALLSAIRDGVPLEEPVSVAKAMMAQEKARISLSGGTGPLATVFLVNIQAQPWTHTEQTATAYADGFNRGVDWLRSSIIEYADKLPPANVAQAGELSDAQITQAPEIT